MVARVSLGLVGARGPRSQPRERSRTELCVLYLLVRPGERGWVSVEGLRL